MFTKGDIVLVDTNVIIEAHRSGCWKPLAAYFSLHTVEKVVEETQTGFQNRREAETIDLRELRSNFVNIQTISDLQISEFLIKHGQPALDDGELQLLVYAETISEKVWYLNSPDIAAIKFAFKNNCGDRLVSLGAMSTCINIKLKTNLRLNYTETWLSQKKINLYQGIL